MKKVKKVEKKLPEEVVSLDEACAVVMENAGIVVEILQDLAFCNKCHGKRGK